MDFLPSRRLQAFSYFLLASGVVLAHSGESVLNDSQNNDEKRNRKNER